MSGSRLNEATALWGQVALGAFLAGAMVSLLDREKIDKAEVADEIEALKRWCAIRMGEPAYRRWVVFRFAESIDYWNLDREEIRFGRILN